MTMTQAEITNTTDELREIQTQILDLLDQANQIVRKADRGICNRAESYWLAHAKMAITKEHFYLGGSTVTMDDTIEEIAGLLYEDE